MVTRSKVKVAFETPRIFKLLKTLNKFCVENKGNSKYFSDVSRVNPPD